MMSKFRNIIFALFIMLLLPSLVNAATLTIDSKSYDEESYEFLVGGNSSYSEVMVSLFDGDDLLSFKTVSASNGKYSAKFNIEFDADKEITIKVGDINSTNYKISTLNVKKSVPRANEEESQNKLVDDSGNSLTVLDKLFKFDDESELIIMIDTDMDNLDEDDAKALEAIEKALGRNKKVIGAMMIYVLDKDGEPIDLKDTTNGYELFLNIGEDDLAGFTSPNMIRILDEEKLEFESPFELVYDKEAKGVIVKLNNIGVYVLYDDENVYYNFLEKTGEQTYNLKKDGELVLKIDAPLDKFLDVYVDDELVDSKNYTTKSGSTIITFKKDYVQKLSKGEHTIVVNFDDGMAIATIDVTNGTNPSTGDSIYGYMVILMIGLLGLAGGIIYNKRYN